MNNTLKTFLWRIVLFSMLNIPSYDFYTNESGYDYEFTSAGRNGLINKIARFDKISANVYNVGFGDWYDNVMYDRNVSNNGDRDLILATVGRIISHFTETSPEALIFARGSDQVRTRLYQQGINRHWDQIGPFFEVWGFQNGEWTPFEKGKNYQAFLGRRHRIFTNKFERPNIIL